MPGRSCTAVAGNPRKAYKFADYLHIASAPGARFRFFFSILYNFQKKSAANSILFATQTNVNQGTLNA